LDSLVHELRNEDPAIRACAADYIGDMGPRGADAVPSLINSLKDRDDRVRCAVIKALGEIGPKASRAVNDLISIADRVSDPGRLDAISSIGQLGPNFASTVVPTLARALIDKDRLVSMVAAGVLEEFGPASAPAVPQLVKFLSKPDVAVAAATILAKIGALARPAVTTLSKSTESPDPAIRRISAYALGCVGSWDRSTVSALRKLLSDPDLDVRLLAAAALRLVEGRATPGTREAMARLLASNEILVDAMSLYEEGRISLSPYCDNLGRVLEARRGLCVSGDDEREVARVHVAAIRSVERREKSAYIVGRTGLYELTEIKHRRAEAELLWAKIR
jgi:hypothetical protein